MKKKSLPILHFWMIYISERITPLAGVLGSIDGLNLKETLKKRVRGMTSPNYSCNSCSCHRLSNTKKN